MIQKSGFRIGGKIAVGYLTIYLKSFFVPARDILFIAGGVGDKAHYRAFGIAEELKAHGLGCSATNQNNPRLFKFADKTKIFIFSKTTYTPKIAKFISEIKKQKKEIIFDTDDLDFDPKYLSHMDYFSKITATEKKEYENGIGAEILNDPYVKTCTTTVSYLAEKLKEKNKRVIIVPNKISNHELEIADKILEKRKKSDEFLRIGYFSGTYSHNKDFATIANALVEILRKYKNVKLVLAGLLDAEEKLNEFGDRIEILPRVPRDEYYTNIYKCDINLAPLEIGNPFCESRSALKFIETGILAIPTVAVKNQTYRETISDGVDGFLAGDTDEWVGKISQLIENENLRNEMGKKAREKVLLDYTNKNSHNEEYYNYLKSKL